MSKNKKADITQTTKYFPPVVAVLGHVDHGKTTLLDAIRKSNIAQKEHGGITQGIGASTIEIINEGVKRKVTFIDTPGHEAFSAMRFRGAQAADIGLLIVSAVDGVMPQTKESTKVLQESGMPIIVVITKVDLPEKNVEKVKQQLLKEKVLLEGLGGDVPVIEVSAKTNKNVDALLDLILLVYELHGNLFADRATNLPFKGVIIESKLDQKAGPKATIIIKNGTLRVRDEIVAGDIESKVRQLLNDQKNSVQQATIGEAVEVLGFSAVPAVGTTVSDNQSVRPSGSSSGAAGSEFSERSSLHYDERTLSIVLVADTYGSLEAIANALPKGIVVTMQKTGDITSSDVFLAKSTKSILIGFNTRVKPDVMHLARTERVLLKNYTIIYELLSELQDVLEGKELAQAEEIFGRAKVLASFPFEKTKVLGITVLEGRVAKGDKARLVRGEEIIGESTIVSVRQGKNQISKIEEKAEGGIILSPLLDFTIGDVLICHR